MVRILNKNQYVFFARFCVVMPSFASLKKNQGRINFWIIFSYILIVIRRFLYMTSFLFVYIMDPPGGVARKLITNTRFSISHKFPTAWGFHEGKRSSGWRVINVPSNSFLEMKGVFFVRIFSYKNIFVAGLLVLDLFSDVLNSFFWGCEPDNILQQCLKCFFSLLIWRISFFFSQKIFF